MKVERRLETGGYLLVDATGQYLVVGVSRDGAGDWGPAYLGIVETEWLIAMLQRGNAIVRTRIVGKPETNPEGA